MSKRPSTLAVLLTTLALLPAAIARAAETIAIMDFTASGASASEATAISGFVRNAVVRSGTYTVVDKKNVDKILQEQAFQQTGCTSQECAVKLGKLLNVKKMVVGEYTMLGGVRFLTASLVDVESSQIERSGKIKGFEVGNADEAADQLVAQLEGKAVPAVTQPQQSVQPMTMQREQPVQPAVTPAPAAQARPYSGGYFNLYIGGAGGTLKKFTEEYKYTTTDIFFFESEGTVTTELEDIVAEGAGPSFGLRVGTVNNHFGVDVEFSMTRLVTPAQTVPGYTTVSDPDTGTTNTQDTFTLPEEFLTINAIAFMCNLYAVIGNGRFQPYIGGGFGLTYLGVESSMLVEINSKRPLDTATMGFGLQLPLGFRFWASDKFFFWGEWHPAIHIMVLPVSADEDGNSQDDFDWNTQVSQVSGGIGFGF